MRTAPYLERVHASFVTSNKAASVDGSERDPPGQVRRRHRVDPVDLRISDR